MHGTAAFAITSRSLRGYYSNILFTFILSMNTLTLVSVCSHLMDMAI